MFVLKLSTNPITLRRLPQLRSIKKLSYQTIHIVNSIATSENYETRNQQLEKFIKHLESNPLERYVAINEGAVTILQNIQRTSSELHVIENARLGLALLGYPGRLKSNGIRILSIDGGGIRALLVIELLKKLETLTNKRIFDLFDMVCGVSTGWIIDFAMTL
jgi:calcium-independent phospholipase A2-gamma